MQIRINSNPEPLDENWIRIDPNDATIAEPTELELRVLRARTAWSKQ
jgi:hypothetical protein